MLTKRVRKFIKENERASVMIGTGLVLVGGYLGYKYFKGFKPALVPRTGKGVCAMVPTATPEHFIGKSIMEIKQILDGIEGAKYADALEFIIDGEKYLYVK